MEDERKPKQDYGYTYPESLQLKPGDDQHDKLVLSFTRRVKTSYDVMSVRYPNWQYVDQLLTGFVPLDKEEKKDQSEDPRRPIQVVVPVSYAALETLLTYQVAYFLTQYPFIKYGYMDDADKLGVLKLQYCIAYDCFKMKFPLKMHTVWRDSYSYGFGAAFARWERQYGYRTRTRVYDDTLTGIGEALEKTYVKEKELVITREGNDVLPIDPYNFFPSLVSPMEFPQAGEFHAFVESTNLIELLRREQTQGYFNIRYLLDMEGSLDSQFNNKHLTGRYDRSGFDPEVIGQDKSADVIHMMIDIIPSQWGFGTSDYPEKWHVGIAADRVIVYIVPGGHNHQLFPVVTDVPNFDGHSITPISMIEMTAGLQKSIDWKFRTHWANAAKVINDVLIVNPNKIHMPDILKPGPKIVRTAKSAAFGGTLDEAVKQLQVSDVTGGYMQDIGQMMGLMGFILGSTPSVNSGLGRRSAERITAEEISTDRQSSLSRLQKIATMSAWQSLYDLGILFAHHTQQYLTNDVYIRIMGELDRELEELYGANVQGFNASPMDLDVNFDVLVSDGIMPWAADPQVTLQLYEKIGQNPVLMERFDIVKLIKRIAKAVNVNLNDVEIKPQVVPDQTVVEQQQAGNYVPMEDYYGQQ